MENFNTVPFIWFALAVVVCLLIMISFRKSKSISDKFDERQLIGRGQAYRLAFFTLLGYTAVYACLDSAGVKWCETAAGLIVGVFVSVTVFAVTAICRDALVGIRGDSKSVLILWSIVIFVQLVCFALDCAERKVIENGVLTLSVVSLVNAVCFIIILAVYLVHEKKAKLPEEEE